MKAFLSAAFVASALLMTSQARAQNTGYTNVSPNGWSGYAPAYSWTYNPATGWSGYVPAPVANVPAPPSGPGYAPPVPGGGYVPGQPLVNNRPAVVARPRTRPRSVSETRFAPQTYREFGTGRSVPTIKPWLPNSPRSRVR